MTRSIFDPTGGEAEHSGSRNLGPEASNLSHLPPRFVNPESEDVELDEAAMAEQDELNAEPAENPVQESLTGSQVTAGNSTIQTDAPPPDDQG